MSFPVDDPRAFVAAYESTLRPMRQRHGDVYWRFALSGDTAHQAELETIEGEMSQLHADEAAYGALDRWAAQGTDDALLARQIALLLPEFRRGQAPEALRLRIIKLGLETEETFTTFRPVVGGRRMASNEMDRELLVSNSDARRREVWEATRAIGRHARGSVVELAQLRNEVASFLGYSDYFTMELADQEMEPEELFGVLDDLRRDTDGPWARHKAELDAEMAEARGKRAEDLMPWDYTDRFLQSVPRRDPGRGTDAWFPLAAIKKNTHGFFRGVGLPVERLWRAADLLPRDGKSPHAFCIGIDNPGDVRVLCNLDSTARWMETTLHEFGHAVYNAGIDDGLPWLLRDAAHTFITEAVAMFFGRMVKTAPWLREVAGVPHELAAKAQEDLREAQLVFARWALLVTYFERAMYADPTQDLESRWWELASRLQGLTRPPGWDGPDWASKVHVACYPAYYQNYLLGELLASQFQAALVQRTGQDMADPSFVGRKEVGDFFGGLFAAGQRQRWDDTVVAHTGQALTSRHWVQQFAS
ncbi:MAG: M2 family metallopeptidase [Deltaproteobacteria bacterium]|nr:M2 family metallopeptidase [Deltaproteobacteria bacterium]